MTQKKEILLDKVNINDEKSIEGYLAGFLNDEDGKNVLSLIKKIKSDLNDISLNEIKIFEAKLEEEKKSKLYAIADLENTKKRLEKDLDNTRKYAINSFANSIIDVVDSFEKAIEVFSKPDSDSKQIIEGVNNINKQLLSVMKSNKIEKIETNLGDKFNAEIHSAMSVENSDKFESGEVIDIYRHGYMIGDRCLRPASVIVSK